MCTHMQNKHNCIEENKEGNKYQISFIFLDSIECVCTMERDKWGGKSYIFTTRSVVLS